MATVAKRTKRTRDASEDFCPGRSTFRGVEGCWSKKEGCAFALREETPNERLEEPYKKLLKTLVEDNRVTTPVRSKL